MLEEQLMCFKLSLNEFNKFGGSIVALDADVWCEVAAAATCN